MSENTPFLFFILILILGVGNVQAQSPELPLNFESQALNYNPSGFGAVDFGSIPTEITLNPDISGINTSDTVWHINKPEAAQVWAGASILLAGAIDFSAGNSMSLKVWSPVAGRTIRFKLEDTNSTPDGNGNPSVFVEIDAVTTVAQTWETLTYDLTTGTGGFSPDSSYNQVVIFPHFGTAGEVGGESYYFDDIEIYVPPVTLPVVPMDFESTTLAYNPAGFGSVDFGPIPTEIIANPDMTGENTSATVLHINKPEAAQTWAGASLDLETPIDFTSGTTFSMKVWSPAAGKVVRFKVENIADGAINGELDATTTVAMAWETLTFDMTQSIGANFDMNASYDRIAIFPHFGTAGEVGGESYYFDDIEIYVPPVTLPVVPMDFESTTLAYNPAGFGAVDFGPIPTEIIANPDMTGENTSATVLHINKPEAAQTWAGASLDLETPIDFTSGTTFSMKVWSPAAGKVVRFKVENIADGAINAEVDATTTSAMTWETLTFDMTQSIGANFDMNALYDRIAIFPHFGTAGEVGGESYYFDDIEIYVPPVGLPVIPMDFESTSLAYNPAGFGAVDFGPIPTEIIANPDMTGENTSATVLHINKPEGAQVWAGASILLDGAIDFTSSTSMSLKVWSPVAGRTIRFKLEDTNSTPDGNGNPSVFVELDAVTTGSQTWETVIYDLNTGMGGFSPDSSYNQVVIFPHFGTIGEVGGESYYFDDIELYVAPVSAPTIPMDFESTSLSYNPAGFGAVDFGPIPTEIIANPDMTGENTSATVLHINKPEGAQVWAGASILLDGAIDFTSSTSMSLKVWSPVAGRTIRFKLEDTNSTPDGNGNPSVFVELDAVTTGAQTWETLIYDLNTGMGGFSPDSSYNQVVIFPHFGTIGEVGGESYYFDDIELYVAPLTAPTIPMDFESTTLAYNPAGFGAADFGPIPTEIIVNPDMSGDNTSATVWHINKPEGAQVWAGASIALENPVDFTASNTITMKVWSPVAGRTILFKLEDTTSPPDGNGNPSVFAEISATTVGALAWETLTFDMTTSMGGFSPDSSYNNVVVFPHFGTLGEVGGESYYFDDIEIYVAPVLLPSLPVTFEDATITYENNGFGNLNSAVISNPDATGINTSATVLELSKTVGANTWAGSAIPLSSAIDLDSIGGDLFSIKVWSPRANVPFLLKFEDLADPTNINTELAVSTTTINTWETLYFYMSQGSNYDPDAAYDQVVVFPDFGNEGAGEIFYVDDIMNDFISSLETPDAAAYQLSLFPNPTESLINVSLNLQEAQQVDIQLMDGLGRVVTYLVGEKMAAGAHQVGFDLSTIVSGNYWLVLRADGIIIDTKPLIVK